MADTSIICLLRSFVISMCLDATSLMIQIAQLIFKLKGGGPFSIRHFLVFSRRTLSVVARCVSDSSPTTVAAGGQALSPFVSGRPLRRGPVRVRVALATSSPTGSCRGPQACASRSTPT